MRKALLVLLFGFLGIGLFAQTEFEAQFTDLPKATQKYVQKNYDGWTVDKAMQGTNEKGKMTSCDILVSKGTEKLKLIFDEDGEFVKKENLTNLQAAPKAVAPAAAPAATPAEVPAQQETK